MVLKQLRNQHTYSLLLRQQEPEKTSSETSFAVGKSAFQASASTFYSGSLPVFQFLLKKKKRCRFCFIFLVLFSTQTNTHFLESSSPGSTITIYDKGMAGHPSKAISLNRKNGGGHGREGGVQGNQQQQQLFSFRHHQQSTGQSVWSSSSSSESVLAQTSSLFITEAIDWPRATQQQPITSQLFLSPPITSCWSGSSLSPPPSYYSSGSSSFFLPDTRNMVLSHDHLDDEEEEEEKSETRPKEKKKKKKSKERKEETTKVGKEEESASMKVSSTPSKSVKFSKDLPKKTTLTSKSADLQKSKGNSLHHHHHQKTEKSATLEATHQSTKPKSILKKATLKSATSHSDSPPKGKHFPSPIYSTPRGEVYLAKPFHYVCLKCYFRAEEIDELLDHLKAKHAHLKGPYLRAVWKPMSEVTAGTSPARSSTKRRGSLSLSSSPSSSSPSTSPPPAQASLLGQFLSR